MSIKFLEVTPERAVAVLVQCIENGWAAHEALWDIAAKNRTNGQISKEEQEKWDRIGKTWRIETEKKLKEIYTSTRHAFKFRKRQINSGMVDGENQDFTRIENGIINRIEILDAYLEFILAHSEPKLTIKGDIYLQVGDLNRQDINR